MITIQVPVKSIESVIRRVIQRPRWADARRWPGIRFMITGQYCWERKWVAPLLPIRNQNRDRATPCFSTSVLSQFPSRNLIWTLGFLVPFPGVTGNLMLFLLSTGFRFLPSPPSRHCLRENREPETLLERKQQGKTTFGFLGNVERERERVTAQQWDLLGSADVYMQVGRRESSSLPDLSFERSWIFVFCFCKCRRVRVGLDSAVCRQGDDWLEKWYLILGTTRNKVLAVIPQSDGWAMPLILTAWLMDFLFNYGWKSRPTSDTIISVHCTPLRSWSLWLVAVLLA